MDCSLSDSSVHVILQARMLEWVSVPFSVIFLFQWLNPGFLNCRQILYHLTHGLNDSQAGIKISREIAIASDMQMIPLYFYFFLFFIYFY